MLLPCLNFVKDLNIACLRENFFIILHVFFCVLIWLENLESPSSKIYCLSKQKILFLVVSACRWIFMSFSLKEFTSNSTRIFITFFIDLNCIISAEKWKQENSVFIIRFSWDQFALESKNVNVLFEDLFLVKFWSFWFKSFNASKRILFTSKTCVWRNGVIHILRILLIKIHRRLGNSESFSVKLMREFIAIKNKHFSPKNINRSSTNQITWFIKLFLFQRHARIMSHHRNLWNLWLL